MRLSRYCDLALRGAMYAAARPQRPVTAKEVAEVFGVSRNHVVKSLQGLAQAGFLHGTAGRGGGFRLARPPGHITLGAVVRALEPSLDLVECFDPDTNACPLAGGCLLEGALRAAEAAFLETLDGVSLDGLRGRSRDRLIGIGRAA